MRSKFDEQLEALHRDLISMGALCESAIALSAKALEEANAEKAQGVFDFVEKIDRAERDIENLCIKLLLQQQPVATDLRIISSALKMVTDMERIGDNSGDIAEIVSMGHIRSGQNGLNLHDMALATIKMVTDSIDAFVKSDRDLARAVIDYDDVVDGHFNRIKSALIGTLRGPEADGEAALDLLMVAKYLERMGDHAVNIAKWVLYAVTGEKEPGTNI